MRLLKSVHILASFTSLSLSYLVYNFKLIFIFNASYAFGSKLCIWQTQIYSIRLFEMGLLYSPFYVLSVYNIN